MNMNVLFPETFQCDAMAIRGMYVIYDHLSDLSRTYNKPGGVPQHYYDGSKKFCIFSVLIISF